MVNIANGAVVRQHDRPEVWRVEDERKRWVPDPETLSAIGGWGVVQVLPLGQVIDNPLGPMLPSVIRPSPGTMARSSPPGRIHMST